MRRIIILLILISALKSVLAQNDNYVTILASGSGGNETEAINVALRNCIEKTYGVFISSSTEIINDEIIKDKISSIGQGTIIDYKIITKSIDGKEVTLSAQISPSKIVDIIKSEGYDIKIKGNIYVQNTIKEEYYKKQELDIIESFFKQYSDIDFFNFEITASEPNRLIPNNNPSDYWNHKLKSSNIKTIKNHYSTIFEKLVNKYAFETPNSLKQRISSYSSYLQFKGYWRKSKDHKWKVIKSLGDYKALDESYSQNSDERKYFYQDNDFRIDILFLPTPNNNYYTFIKEFWNLVNEIQVKDVETFNQLVGDPSYIYNGNKYKKNTPTPTDEEVLEIWRKENNIKDIVSYEIMPGMPNFRIVAATVIEKRGPKTQEIVKTYKLNMSKMIAKLSHTKEEVYALRNPKSIIQISKFFEHIFQQSTSFSFLDSERINGIDKSKYISVINGNLNHIFDENKQSRYRNKNARNITLYPYVFANSRNELQTFPPSRLFIYLTIDELNNLEELKFAK